MASEPAAADAARDAATDARGAFESFTMAPLRFSDHAAPGASELALREIDVAAYRSFPAVSADGSRLAFLWADNEGGLGARANALDIYDTSTGTRVKRIVVTDDSAMHAARRGGKLPDETEKIKQSLVRRQDVDLATANALLGGRWRRMEEGLDGSDPRARAGWERLDEKREARGADPGTILRFGVAQLDIELADAPPNAERVTLLLRRSPDAVPVAIATKLPPASTTCAGWKGSPPCGRPCGWVSRIEGYLSQDRRILLLGSRRMASDHGCIAAFRGDTFTVVRLPPLP